MGVSYAEARASIGPAAAQLFAADPRIHAVGVSASSTGFHFRAVVNTAMAVNDGSAISLTPDIGGISVAYVHALGHVRHHAQAALATVAESSVPERAAHRPLTCGLQIQNFDQDTRTGATAVGIIDVGSIGCFVRTRAGRPAILSNNHVLAGANAGQAGDRIAQPGGADLVQSDVVANLGAFVPLTPSPPGATPAQGNAVFNSVDCALAEIAAGLQFRQDYLRSQLPSPAGVAAPACGDPVFKVGRTTGLTRGTITDVHTIVGPITFAGGPTWFSECFTVEGDGGSLFSDQGDSGAAIVRNSGQVVGLLFSGNGQQSFACPIATVLSQLQCTLI